MTFALPGHVSSSRSFAVRRTDPLRHSVWTRAFHWSSAVAILVASLAALARELTEDQPLRIVLMDVHRQLGLFVLIVWLPRLVVRLRKGLAHDGAPPAALERWAAQCAHVALYMMLLAMPVLGWAVCNAHATPVRLFGLVTLPSLVQADSDLADELSDWHIWGAWALLGLVCLHLAAACWHHWVRRDNVLVAMLPSLGMRRGRPAAEQRSRVS